MIYFAQVITTSGRAKDHTRAAMEVTVVMVPVVSMATMPVATIMDMTTVMVNTINNIIMLITIIIITQRRVIIIKTRTIATTISSSKLAKIQATNNNKQQQLHIYNNRQNAITQTT